jgi:hypothetical protein
VTPGNELPGAFPNRGQAESSTDATNITETLVVAAKQYFPASVMDKVETFLGNNNSTGSAGNNQEVRASEHDIYHKASLPSQELRGALANERVGGVGSLPGASVEKSVALLPDQQPEWSEWSTFAGRNTPGYQTPRNLKENAIGLGQTAAQKATKLAVDAGIVKADVPPKLNSGDVGEGYPETLTSRDIAGAQQAVSNIKPVAFDIKQAQDVSMPSAETQGQQTKDHTDGVGSLPGSKDEEGVAVLPEERAAETAGPVRLEHREQQSCDPTENTKDTGSMGVGFSDATYPLKNDTQKDTELKDPQTEIESATPDLKTTRSEFQPSASFEPDNLSGNQMSANGGTEVQQHKSSLKDKFSGRMKVVTGKLSHDKSKVEEGKKLLSGQSA